MDVRLTNPRRRRFQFSLSTLLIVVIAYGLLWVLTIKWGANQLAWEKTKDNEFGNAQLGGPVLKGDGIVEYSIMFDEKPEVTTSPAPFILIWHRNMSLDERNETYFWFFGLTYRLQQKKLMGHW